MSIMAFAWLLPVLLASGVLLLAAQKKHSFSPRLLAEIAASLLLGSLPFLAVAPFSPITKIVLSIAQLFAILLPLRIIFGRLDKNFVFVSTNINVAIFLAVVSLAIAGYLLGTYFPGILGSYYARIAGLICLSFATGLLFLGNVLVALHKYKVRVAGNNLPIAKMPTVSVCIPARNETHALEDCLVSVLTSTYQKLEILVLDDCSQDKTSQVIRSFARDGVRFVQGAVPADGWLGRNQAMQTLAEQANGDFILFMSVDTRVLPHSITHIVAHALDKQADMVSVLPQNRLGLHPGAVFATLRNFWLSALPITKRRVPVSSQFWLIRASALRHLGGFESVKQKIMPEQSFARRLFSANAYRFILGATTLGITTAKKWSSLAETAVRILYPSNKRQPFYVFLACGGLMCALLGPFVTTVWLACAGDFGSLFWLSCGAYGVLFASYAITVHHAVPRMWLLTAICLPITLVQECILLLISMLQYEFGEVNWKGRNVCYPVIAWAGNPAQRR